MKTIYKYQLKTTDDQIIEMPSDAEILTVQVQNGIPCIWVKVNTELPTIPYHFKIHGAGHPVTNDYNYKYIGTYQLNNGELVFHVWFIV
jgi:hypothetical protein